MNTNKPRAVAIKLSESAMKSVVGGGGIIGGGAATTVGTVIPAVTVVSNAGNIGRIAMPL